MVLANAQGLETYQFEAATESVIKKIPFPIYFLSCRDTASLVKVDNFVISKTLLIGETVQYTDTYVGFTTTDPTNCPLGATGAGGFAEGFTAKSYTFRTVGTG